MAGETQPTTILDRLWLWGMKVNTLQAGGEYKVDSFKNSTLTVEQAIQLTGIRNIYMAGGLEIDARTLADIPSAKRIVCKWALHRSQDGKLVLDTDACFSRLSAAKELAKKDTRIEGVHIDDFSTGSMDAGAKPEHVAQMQFLNATAQPLLPLYGTFYTMTMQREGIAEMMRYFDVLILPLWHYSELETLEQRFDRSDELSGGKPILLALYVYDWGNNKQITRDEMAVQLDFARKMIKSQRVTGLLVCGTCMLDIGWESADYYCEWIKRVGDEVIG